MTGRDRLVVMVVVALAAVAASWLLVIQPKRHTASDLANQITAQQTQLDTARSQVEAAMSAFRSFGTNYQQMARLGEAVPADDNVPSLIYEIQGAAKAAGVDFRNLQLAPGASGTSSSTSSSSSSGAAAAAPAPLPPGAAVGPAGLPAEQFTFTFRGNFFHLSDFFKRIQNFVIATDKRISISGRLMTVNSINLAAAPTGFPKIDATVAATTYIVPATEGPLGGATPAGPAGTTATAPTTSSATPTATITPSAR
jgi:hypothetical protein